MTTGMGRRLWIAMMALVSIAASAHAQTWSSIAMPTIATSGTETLNTVAPYALGLPPCTPSCDHHYRSSLTSSVKGFQFRGDAIVIGSGTNPNNLFSVFFTDSSTYTGSEYGLVVDLSVGEMHLYQCGNCNTAGQNWTETSAWTTPGDYNWYQVVVNIDGSFTVKVINPMSPFQTRATVNVPKATWLPNLYQTAGYLTIVAGHYHNDGSWSSSAIHVDEIDVGL